MEPRRIVDNDDTGAAVAGNGAHHMNANDEHLDHGGGRTRGRVEEGQLQMATGQLADVAQLRRNGWIAEHGGFVFPNDSALSDKTKKTIDWELMNTHHDVIPMYQERAVWESRYPQRAWGPE